MLDWCYENRTKQQEKQLLKLQNYVLNNSVQFIWHLHQQMNTVVTKQKELSGKIIQRLLFKNESCIGLATRLFPSTLFTEVAKKQNEKELVNKETGRIETDWQLTSWEKFLELIPVDQTNPR